MVWLSDFSYCGFLALVDSCPLWLLACVLYWWMLVECWCPPVVTPPGLLLAAITSFSMLNVCDWAMFIGKYLLDVWFKAMIKAKMVD
jgi:hypothetical protein